MDVSVLSHESGVLTQSPLGEHTLPSEGRWLWAVQAGSLGRALRAEPCSTASPTALGNTGQRQLSESNEASLEFTISCPT